MCHCPQASTSNIHVDSTIPLSGLYKKLTGQIPYDIYEYLPLQVAFVSYMILEYLRILYVYFDLYVQHCSYINDF